MKNLLNSILLSIAIISSLAATNNPRCSETIRTLTTSNTVQAEKIKTLQWKLLKSRFRSTTIITGLSAFIAYDKNLITEQTVNDARATINTIKTWTRTQIAKIQDLLATDSQESEPNVVIKITELPTKTDTAAISQTNDTSSQEESTSTEEKN